MRFGLVGVALIGGLMLVGRNAEAQARGTLQASATVVDTRQGFEALAAVQQTIMNPRRETKQGVATVAVISTERPATDPQKMIVTVDFARN